MGLSLKFLKSRSVTCSKFTGTILFTKVLSYQNVSFSLCFLTSRAEGTFHWYKNNMGMVAAITERFGFASC